METFLFFYRQKHHSVRLMADDLHRQRMAKNFTDWFQANLHCFQWFKEKEVVVYRLYRLRI